MFDRWPDSLLSLSQAPCLFYTRLITDCESKTSTVCLSRGRQNEPNASSYVLGSTMNRISLLHSIGLGNRRYLVLSSSQTVGHNGRKLCFYYEDQMKRSSLLRTSNCFGVDASTSLYTNMFMRLWSRPIFTTSGRSVRLDGHLPSF